MAVGSTKRQTLTGSPQTECDWTTAFVPIRSVRQAEPRFSRAHTAMSMASDFERKARRQARDRREILQSAGYQTAIVGKWHLGHGGHADPTGFDLPGTYCLARAPTITPNAFRNGPGASLPRVRDGYHHGPLPRSVGVAEITKGPFLLMCHHKAPHRPGEPSEKYRNLYEDIEIPYPEPSTTITPIAPEQRPPRRCGSNPTSTSET